MIIISIHLFPHEIKRFRRIVQTFKKSVPYIEDTSQIKMLVTLNTNSKLIDWGTESDDIVCAEFEEICKTIPFAVCWEIKNEPTYLGVNEHRRNSIHTSLLGDTIIFLDTDLYFEERLLAHQINAISLIKTLNEYYVISPQILRLWDATWDCIVNKKYLDKPLDYYKTATPIDHVNVDHGSVGVLPIQTFKWGGGWFNAISANLLKYIGLPESFVGYGPDDTFVMECCKIMKKHNKDIQQYVLSNMIVMEDQEPIESSIKLKNNTLNFREECNKHFLSEISKFTQKL